MNISCAGVRIDIIDHGATLSPCASPQNSYSSYGGRTTRATAWVVRRRGPPHSSSDAGKDTADSTSATKPSKANQEGKQAIPTPEDHVRGGRIADRVFQRSSMGDGTSKDDAGGRWRGLISDRLEQDGADSRVTEWREVSHVSDEEASFTFRKLTIPALYNVNFGFCRTIL